MPDRKTPISLRISTGDADFIASLTINGATTPSEKIRHLIKEARHRQERKGDYQDVLLELENRVIPAMVGLKAREHADRQHSEIIALFAEWLPEATAEFLASTQNVQTDADNRDELETAITDRMARLFERNLRIMLAPENSSYQPDAFLKRMESVLKLALFVKKQREEK